MLARKPNIGHLCPVYLELVGIEARQVLACSLNLLLCSALLTLQERDDSGDGVQVPPL